MRAAAAATSLPLVLQSMTDATTASVVTAADDPYAPHWELHPKSYPMQRAPVSLWDAVDGNIDKDVWQAVPFSDAFGDIQGDADRIVRDAASSQPTIGETRFKALYDDDYLYIAAVLHPSPDGNLPTIASFTERNSPIYQKDSDFEVFIDVFGSHHMYKEFEVNAINTVWNLGLDKPYENGGSEHSGRIARPGEALYYEVKQQRTATRIVQGHVNDGDGATWTVEMAWSIHDLYQSIPTTKDASMTSIQLPRVWRINFSRVELQGDVNWTWQAQQRWDAQQGQYRGYVNMHLPDAWGYLVFDGSTDNMWRDPHWPAKLTATTVYYAMHQYRHDTGHCTNQTEALTLPPDIVKPFDVHIDLLGDEDWCVTVTSRIDRTAVNIRQDRYLSVVTQRDESADRTIVRNEQVVDTK